MSGFLSGKYSALTPYVPGEQPKERKYIKLNTNESPFPPAPGAIKLAAEEAERLNLYSDPECRELVGAAADFFGLEENQLLFTNGSDEILNFAFMAFCDSDHPAVFPDITYGFYPVFAALNGVPYEEIPVKDDFSIDPEDYIGVGKTAFIANPNAPTGLVLPLRDIERIVRSNPDNVVVVDEAYIDFGGESAIGLIDKYKNLLVCRTFSKSRSMAGARLGFGAGDAELIQDLNTIKYSTNPYNVNRMTMAAGVGSLLDREYFERTVSKIKAARDFTARELRALGFTFNDSGANFLFVSPPKIGGAALFKALRERGILVRYFDKPRLREHIRVSIGSREEMEAFIEAAKEILEETK